MELPFTIEQFLDVFRRYNSDVWPAQAVLIIIAVAAVYFSIRRTSYSDKIIVGIFCFFWIWMGIVYHLIYFSKINNAAIGFGVLFIVQSLLLFYYGIIRTKLVFQFRAGRFGVTGMILIAFALVIYPLLGFWFGRVYPASPTFGLPCPTTSFTFGILLFAVNRIPVIVIIIPFLWSLLGFSAAFSLGITEDTGLLVAGLLFIVLIINRSRSLKEAVS